MSCKSCARAERDPDSGMYHIGCNECETRQLAHAFTFWDRRLQPDRYKQALARVVRQGETAEAAHARVMAWAERFK